MCHHRAVPKPDLPEPLAQGDLARTPFAHVLLHIRQKGYSGSLVVWRTDAEEGQPTQDRIRFEEGRPVAAFLTEPASKIERGMLPLFARTGGPYAFYEDVDLVGDGARIRTGKVDVLPLIAASLRGSSRDDVAASVVRRFGDSLLRLHRGVDINNMGLLPDERNTVDLLRAKPMPASRLRELSPLEPRMVLRLIYFLAITRSIEPWDGQIPKQPARPAKRPARRKDAAGGGEADQAKKDAGPEPPAPPPDGLSAEHRERWTEIAERAKAIETQTYFDMLGVPKDASAANIQKAYFGLVKKWHPDRLPGELSELRPFVERIFRYLTRANETLSDPAERGKYLATVQEGGGTPEKERELAAIVNAAMEFRKVEVLMRRREHDRALELVEEILEVAPDEADYHATRGYLLYQLHPGAEKRTEILAALDRALELSPDHDKAHYYKGMALKRWGSKSQALTHFKKAAELNPKNIEATREVRLASMRGSLPADEPTETRKKKGDAGGGLFGKIFGGKKK